jgi:ribosomal protein S12 methylthiotransferase
MRRGQDGNQFLKLIERIRRTIPSVALRTSMIVGFPGETQEDFEELCQFVEAAQFDRLGVFAYSDEEGTRSYELDGKLDGRTIHNRQRRLMAVQRKISRRRNRALVGGTFDLLLDGVSAESEWLWEGRLATQAPDIDGKVLINDVTGDPPQPGAFVKVKITRALDYDLIGTVIAAG